MKCGVFDSGIGGLSVAGELLKARLFREIVYFGDTARVPYGNRNESTIIRYSLEALEFLKNFDIDFLVVACNSASAWALEELKKEANFPVVGVIEAGVEGVKKLPPTAPILLTGTRATIKSQIYQRELKREGYSNLIALPTPLFVPFVEEGLWKGSLIEAVFAHYFHHLNREKVEGVILGCTHYPFLSPIFQKFFPNATLIHSGKSIVEYLRRHFHFSPAPSTSFQIYASENVAEVRQKALHWLTSMGVKITLETGGIFTSGR
jgi:glutamate racemase